MLIKNHRKNFQVSYLKNIKDLKEKLVYCKRKYFKLFIIFQSVLMVPSSNRRAIKNYFQFANSQTDE